MGEVRGTTTAAPAAPAALASRRVGAWGLRGTLWALAPTALASLVVLASLRAPVTGSDEGLLLVHPESVADGAVPNRDFATVYGPMTYWVLVGAYRLFGAGLVVERSVGVAYRVVIAVALVLLLRRVAHPVAASLAGVASLLIGTLLFPLAYAYHGAQACALAGLCLLTVRREPARFLGGVALGVAATFRPEMGVLALAALPLLAGRPWRTPVAGWLVGLSPLAVHLAVGGRAVLDDIVLGRAGINTQIGPPGVLLVAAAVVVVGCAVALWWVGRRVADPALRALGIAGVLLVPNMVQRLDAHHVTLPAAVVVAAVIGLLATRAPWLREGPVRLVPALSALACGLVAIVPALTSPSPEVHHAGRSVYLAPEQVRPVGDVLETVDAVSRPTDVVFVGPQDLSEPVLPSSWIYHLLPTHPRPFRYEEFLPGLTEQADGGLVEDLRSADVLVLEDLSVQAARMAPYVPRGPESANRVVQEEFCPVAEHENMVVLVRQDRCAAAREATAR